MARHITIIQGHPDPAADHFGRALATAYANAAASAGHEVKIIDVANLDFPLLRTKEDYVSEAPPRTIQLAQQKIAWAGHLVFFYPLWLGGMPALLKGFMEQAFRPGFAMKSAVGDGMPQQLLKGRSARIVVTMGMPAFFYRWYFGAHGLKNLERSILRFSGIAPIRESLVGMVEDSAAQRGKWLAKMRALGAQAA